MNAFNPVATLASAYHCVDGSTVRFTMQVIEPISEYEIDVENEPNYHNHLNEVSMRPKASKA